MSTLAGLLGVSDADRTYLTDVGARQVFDAVNMTMAKYNEAREIARAVFVDRTTTDYKWRYYLPGGGAEAFGDTVTAAHARGSIWRSC